MFFTITKQKAKLKKMNRKQYITPETNSLELGTMSIMAGSDGLNETATKGGFNNPRPGTGSTKKYAPSRNGFNPWEQENPWEQAYDCEEDF